MQLHLAAQDILSSLRHFLKQMDEAKYRQQVESLSNSTIGQHTRHTIEFFQCLIEQAEQGVINYDKRSRNQLMEEYPHVALQSVERIAAGIKNAFSDKPLMLETTFSDSEDDYSLIPSNYQREWSYVLEHAIHHMAIIKIGAKILAPEITLPESFGVAPSTIKHRHRQCAP